MGMLADKNRAEHANKIANRLRVRGINHPPKTVILLQLMFHLISMSLAMIRDLGTNPPWLRRLEEILFGLGAERQFIAGWGMVGAVLARKPGVR
jgi:hypothetical protein